MILDALGPPGPALHEYALERGFRQNRYCCNSKTSVFGPKSGFWSPTFQPSVLTRNGVHIRVGTVNAHRLHIWIINKLLSNPNLWVAKVGEMGCCNSDL